MAIIPSLESKSEYGTVKIIFWGKDGIGIRSIHPLIVNRVETVVDAHLMEYGGEYQIQKHEEGNENYMALSVRRHDDFQPVSQSARNKIKDMVLMLTKVLLEAKPSLFREGEIVRLTNELERNQTNQTHFQRRLDRLEAEAIDLQLQFEKLSIEDNVLDPYDCVECGAELSVAEYSAGNGICEDCISKTYVSKE